MMPKEIELNLGKPEIVVPEEVVPLHSYIAISRNIGEKGLLIIGRKEALFLQDYSVISSHPKETNSIKKNFKILREVKIILKEPQGYFKLR